MASSKADNFLSMLRETVRRNKISKSQDLIKKLTKIRDAIRWKKTQDKARAQGGEYIEIHQDDLESLHHKTTALEKEN